MTDRVDLDELERVARAALTELDRLMDGGEPSLSDKSWQQYMLCVHPIQMLALIAELRSHRAECAAWDTLQAWQLHPRKRAQYTMGVGRHVITLITTDAYYNPTEVECVGATLQEALTMAADQCRSQLPSPPEAT